MKKIKIISCSALKNKEELDVKYPFNITKSVCLSDKRIKLEVVYENTKSLPVVYNKYLKGAKKDTVLVFSHDDSMILDENFYDSVVNSLKTYNVVGVAGTAAINFHGKPLYLWH